MSKTVCDHCALEYPDEIMIKEGGRSKVSLIIEGIHCAACVWLNERVLGELEGIVEANINLTTHKAKIIWKHEKISSMRCFLRTKPR